MLCGLFSSWESKDYSLVGVHRLLVVVASLIAERGLQSAWALVVEACRLSSCGTYAPLLPFWDQGLKLCLLHWQVDSLPLSHQGSPKNIFLSIVLNLQKNTDFQIPHI